jgi:hypothetical protein
LVARLVLPAVYSATKVATQRRFSAFPPANSAAICEFFTKFAITTVSNADYWLFLAKSEPLMAANAV